jgi:hypothetical protein
MEKEVPANHLYTFNPQLLFSDDDDETELSESDLNSTFGFLVYEFRNFFVDNIPIEVVKDLPKFSKFNVSFFCCLCLFISCCVSGKYLVGSISYAIVVAIFIYFTYTNYVDEMVQAFISLDPTSGQCTSVPISISTTYLADQDGNWEGSANFVYYKSLYSFTFSSFEVDSLSQYQQMMDAYYSDLLYYGSVAKQHNIAYNLLLWMGFTRFYSVQFPTHRGTGLPKGNLQYIQLTGDPAVIFNGRYSSLALGSPAGLCEISTMTIYDEANGLFRSMINEKIFMNQTKCGDVTSPFLFETNLNTNPYFAVTLDVHSFTIALGVNLNILDIGNLLKSSEPIIELNLQNITYSVGKFYDIRYPFMSSIFCMHNISEIPIGNKITVQRMCLVESGSGLFLPVFNHLGNSFSDPVYCDCANSHTAHSFACNEFYLMAGLIAFPLDYDRSNNTFLSPSIAVELVRKAYSLLSMHDSDYAALNKAAYNASAISVMASLNTASAKTRDPQTIANAFDFCRISPDVTCSLILFASLDQVDEVSEYQYALTNGSCTDSFLIPPPAWAKLADNPPTPLTQIYYKCYQDSYSAFLTAVGVASGNTSIATLVLMFFLVPLCFGMMACCRMIPRKQEYKESEKQRTLDTLATMILRSRDHYYEGVKPKGFVSQLAGEMIEAVKYSNYCVKKEVENEKPSLSKSIFRNFSSFDMVEKEDDEPTSKEQRQLLGSMVIYRRLNQKDEEKDKLPLAVDSVGFEDDRYGHKETFTGNSPMT